MRTIVIVPIFWGTAWRASGRPIVWTEVDADIRTVASSYYFAGLNGHGLAATGVVHPAVLVDAAHGDIPDNFHEDAIWSFLDSLVDSGRVPSPTNWNAAQYRVYYGIAIAPGHSNADPSVFGQNKKDYRGMSAGYATANSNRAGVVTTYMHEVVEGAANDEIVDACRIRTFDIGGVRVSRYMVGGRCWPHIDLEVTADPSEPRIEGPFSASVPIADGLCGTDTLDYHVEQRAFRVRATASAPQLDPSTFLWSVNGVVVPRASVVQVPVNSVDPRPPATPRRPTSATISVDQAAQTLSFTTKPSDGNYEIEIRVETLASAAATDSTQINGIRCPELEAADAKCRDWISRAGRKLDRDWNHWVDPGDPIVDVIRKRPDGEHDRFLVLVSHARQLRALGRPTARDFAVRVANALAVKPSMVVGKTRLPPSRGN